MQPNIWLISVDAKLASTLSGLLSSHGFIAEQVSEKPVTFDRNPKPTAIVLGVVDSGMPALNVLVSARKLAPPVPVVVLVGPDQARIAVEALKLGATDAVVMHHDHADLISIYLAAYHTDTDIGGGRSQLDNS